MAEIIPPQRSEHVTVDGVPTLRFMEFLEGLSGGVNEITNEVSITETINDSAQQTATINTLMRRLDDLEATCNFDELNSKILSVRSTVLQLVNDLITAVGNLNVNENAETAQSNQMETIRQLRLLNMRYEEATNTGIGERDA